MSLFISAANASMLQADTMGCDTVDDYKAVLQEMRDETITIPAEMRAHVLAVRDKWIKSGKCSWLNKGLSLVVLDTVQFTDTISMIEVQPENSSITYWIFSSALLPQN
jgi:hypothetical protein